MATFIDNLLSGSWYLQGAFAQYLAFTGGPDMNTAATRAGAVKLKFHLVQAISDTRAQVNIQIDPSSPATYLALDATSKVTKGATPTTFIAAQTRTGIFVLATGINGDNGNFMIPAPSGGTFLVAATGVARAQHLSLAPGLPQGPLIWRFETAQGFIGNPYIYGPAVLLGDKNTVLNCFDKFTGQILWEYGDGTGATSAPEVNYASSIVYAGGTDGKVHAVNLNNGTGLWTTTPSALVYARPSAYVGTLLVPSSDGVLYAHDAQSGAALWRFPQTGTMEGIFVSPRMWGARVFVGGWDGKLHAVNATDGAELWSFDAGGKVSGGISVNETGVYFGADTGTVFALALADGAQLWSVNAGAILSGRPAIHDGALLLGTFAGDAISLDLATGSQNWKMRPGGAFSSDVFAVGHAMYLNTSDGKVYCLDTATGNTLGTYAAAAKIDGSAVIIGGVIYVGDTSGKFAALGNGLTDVFYPGDAIGYLDLLAAQEASPSAPRPPPYATLVQTFAASGGTAYGVAALFRQRLFSDDGDVLVLAMGVDDARFNQFYNFGTPIPADVPADIMGTGAPSGAQAKQDTLANYVSMQAAIRAAIAATGVTTVQVIGFHEGGGLATLAAMDLATPKSGGGPTYDVTTYSFGAPPVGNAVFAAAYDRAVGKSNRIVQAHDPFAGRIGPAQGFVHVHDEIVIGAAGVAGSGNCSASDLACYRASITGAG